MGFLLPVIISACLMPAPRPAVGDHPIIRLGMGIAEVERLVGEPLYGYERHGDALKGFKTASYRLPRLKEIAYANNRVISVTPPQTQPIQRQIFP